MQYVWPARLLRDYLKHCHGVQPAMLVLRDKEVDQLGWNHIFFCCRCLFRIDFNYKRVPYFKIFIFWRTRVCAYGWTMWFFIQGAGWLPSHTTQPCKRNWHRLALLPYLGILIFLFLDTFSITFRLGRWVEPSYSEIWHCQPSLSRAQFGIGSAWSDGSFLWRWGGLGAGMGKAEQPNHYNYNRFVKEVSNLAEPDRPQRRSRAANTSANIAPGHYMCNVSAVCYFKIRQIKIHYHCHANSKTCMYRH